MAEVVAPPLDLEGNVMTVQVVEYVGGLTLGDVQPLGEAVDHSTVDDMDKMPQDNRNGPDPVDTSCVELTQAAAGGEGEESSWPCCDANGSKPALAGSEELPSRLCDTVLPAQQPLCHVKEEAGKTSADSSELSRCESAESTQLLGAETEMLSQPLSGKPVNSEIEESAEPLSVITAESTQPVYAESDEVGGSEGNYNELQFTELADSLSMKKDRCTQLLVAGSNVLPQPEDIDINPESSLNEESKESLQYTCIESGESMEHACVAEESEPNGSQENGKPVESVCTLSQDTIQPLCDHKQSEPHLCQESEKHVPSLCSENGQSTHSGSISDSKGLEPSQTQKGQPVHEESAHSDSSASLPEADSCPSRSQPKTDSAIALVANSKDTCDSPTNQRELEETTPDCTAYPAELPGKHNNMTTERELSRSPEELVSTEPQRLMSTETQTEILSEASVVSQKQPEQEKTDVEATQEEQIEGITGGNEAADAPALGATSESGKPNGGLESPGDLSSGEDLTADSQDEALDGSGNAEAQQSNTSGSGSSPSGDTPTTSHRKKTTGRHSFNRSKYDTVSYRKIRKGNTRKKIDEFEAMMNI